MKIRVLEDRCQGHAICVITCPELFELREEDGHAIVPSPDVPRELEHSAREARDSCPEQAIEISEA